MKIYPNFLQRSEEFKCKIVGKHPTVEWKWVKIRMDINSLQKLQIYMISHKAAN